MYESIAILKGQTVTVDAAGNEVITYPAEKARQVFVKPRSVYANDFYNAANSGLRPAVVLVLTSAEDYQGEKVVEYNDRLYTVLRVYQRPERDAVELTLEERLNNGR